MEWIQCPACNKRIKSLKGHYRASHPDLDVPDLRNPGLASEPEQPKERVEPLVDENEPVYKEGQEQPRQEPAAETSSDFMQKLKMLGISPDDVKTALGPLVETSVVQTLEKMQLGEAINKKMADVEARLGEKIKPLTDLAEQAKGQVSGNGGEVGGGVVTGGRNALMDTVLAGIAQKLLNPNSGGQLNLENLVKQQTSLYQLIEAVTKPQRDAEDAMLRRVTAIINLGSKAGKTPVESLHDYGSSP